MILALAAPVLAGCGVTDTKAKFMINSRMARERAEREFLSPAEREDINSESRTLETGRLDVQAKTAKLKALRLAHEAKLALEPAKPKKAPVRRKKA